ncbi:SAF domain-containing protein [Nocardiopsis coralliicola]
MPVRAALALSRHRRGLAALCAGLALVGALLVVRPPPERVEHLVVAARDLSPLDPVAADAVRTARIAAAAAPDGALRTQQDAVGRLLTGPVRRGEVLTTARFADAPAADYGPGLVAAPVRIADGGAVALLAPGSRVDVLAAAALAGGDFAGPAPPQEAAALAEDRPVIAVPGDGSAAPGGGAGGGGSGGALIVVAVTPGESRRIAGHGAAGPLSLTIRG